MLRMLFESVSVGILSVDSDGVVSAANARAEQLLGFGPEELFGTRATEVLRCRSTGQRGECTILQPLSDVRAREGEEFLLRRDGSVLPVAWASAPILLAGEVTGAVVAFYDVTSRRTLEQQQRDQLAAAVAVNERLALLAEASAVLSETLELREALRRLAEVVVPVLADWSVVDLLGSDGTVDRVAIAHDDPARRTEADSLVGPLPAPLPGAARAPLVQVLQGGHARLLAEFPEPSKVESPLHSAQLALFQRFQAGSAVIAPLIARGRTVGALTVVRRPDRAPYGPDDVVLIDDLARRAALVVDNARLYEQERHTSELLQRHMLPRLPRVGARAGARRALPSVGGRRPGRR